MRVVSTFSAALMVGVLSAACGGSGGGGEGGNAEKPIVTITPEEPTVLTCTQQRFDAKVTSASDTGVVWSAEPGTIDAKGLYTAPIQVPSPASATIVAKSSADPTASSLTVATLATALVGPDVPATTPEIGEVLMYQHMMARRGARLALGYPTLDNHLRVRVSDDGGKTWSVASEVASALDGPARCVSVAIDAVNPDVIYMAYTLPDTGLFKDISQAPTTNSALVFAVSSDAGKTWASTPLILGGYAGGPFGGQNGVASCPDVISPAKDTVIVEAPGFYVGDGNPDVFVFSDASRGDGWKTGQAASYDYRADGATGALATVARDLGLDVGQNGGSGEIEESPRLFTDGKGKTCVVWTGYGTMESKDGVYVQCSTDHGKTFSAPVAVTKAAHSLPHLPSAAFGPKGEIAVVWVADMDPAGSLLFAVSADGVTFSEPSAIPLYPGPEGSTVTARAADIAFDDAGILWVTYSHGDGGLNDRIIVDKSCDGGKTWSGATLVNGPEGSVAHARLPALVAVEGATSVVSFSGVGSNEGAVAHVARLVP